MNGSTATKNRVIVALSGGLGNQLFQLAAGLFVAGLAPVQLDHALLPTRQWQLGRPDIAGFRLPPNVQLLSKTSERAPTRRARAGIRAVMRSGLNTTRWDAKPHFKKWAQSLASALVEPYVGDTIPVIGATGHGYDPAVELLSPPALLVGYFQTWRYAARESTRKSLLALNLVAENPWVDEARKRASQENPLVVHVRLGDYKDDKSFGIPGPEYYATAFDHLSSRNGHDRIWLFSDEPEQALRFMPVRIRNQRPRVVRPGPSVDPAGVMTVMREGRAFVLANSTFGYWSAVLSDCRPEAVAIPDPWFREIAPFESFAPSTWIRIPSFHKTIW